MNKLTLLEIKEKPKKFGEGFCIYGELSEKVINWIDYWKLSTTKAGPYTNIDIPKEYDLKDLFEVNEPYEYIDGFSPNLNKHLHLGHISNFTIAKAFQKMGVGKSFVANLGDTLTTGTVEKEEAFSTYLDICNKFDYHLDKIFMASELIDSSLDLKDGEGDYESTKVFELSDSKVVGVKANGNTTYFYQDVVLAKKLNAKTLYLTGFEQEGHFKNLKELYPHINHLPLGLVLIDGKKMSSSAGNVILFSEIIDILKKSLGDDDKLIWNVLCGYILKSKPDSVKNIELKNLNNVKESQGLYLSYTLAKLKSAGLEIVKQKDFNSQSLAFKLLKAKSLLQPDILFGALVDLAKDISSLYVKHHIKDNEDNQKMFLPLAQDLLFGMEILGMFNIDKV